MAEQVIGTARIDITASSEGVEAAAAKAKASIASMSKEAQAQYSQLSAAEKRRIDSLIRQADTASLTRTQQIAYNAALKSSGPLLDDITRRLKATESAAKSTGSEFNKYGLTAKMELAALRQVPAQITDIIVSLQGGQRPLTVLLQQGGQLRDIFGGVVPAVRALGGALLGMLNPATLSLGAIAALSAAWFQGSREMDAYRNNLIMTGGALGVTVDQAALLAAEMSKMEGVTRGQAAAALTEVAKSGKIAGDQLQTVSEIAVRSAQLLGRETQEVVEEFVKLAEDPVKASEELNSRYHYLTAAVYEQIVALREQGREQAAVRLAQETYANATNRRLDEVRENLGYLESAWKTVTGVAKGAWDAMMGVGRSGLANELEVARKTLEQMEGGYFKTNPKIIAAQREYVQSIEDEIASRGWLAQLAAESQRRENEQIQNRKEWSKIMLGNLSEEEKLEKEIARIRTVGAAAGMKPSEIEDAVAIFRERHTKKERKGSGPKRNILYDDLEDLIASPGVRKSLEDYQRELDSVANLIDDRLITAQRKYNGELASMGQGDWARQVRGELESIEERYNRIIEQRRTSAQGLSFEDEAALRAAMERELQMATGFYAKMKEQQGSWLLGASEGLLNYADEAANVYKSISSLASESYRGMTDALTEFVMTGKASFSDLTNSIIRDMIRIQIQQSITGPLASGLRLFGAETLANMSSDPIGSLISSLGGATGNAKGGVYDSPSLSTYSNQIHDKPKFFQFAKGAGVFAEAGPEAIMPLKRGPDGTLGVKAHGTDSTPIAMKVEIINQTSAPVQARDGGMAFNGKEYVQSIVLEDVQRRGPMARAIVGLMGAR